MIQLSWCLAILEPVEVSYIQYQKNLLNIYRKVASSNKSRLEGHADFFRLLMKGNFDTFVLRTFDKKLIS